MASEISVERQFHFHCSCGGTTVSGERTVTCTACGITLGVRRARRHRQHRRDCVAYYGSRGTLPVRRVERPRQEPTAPTAEAQVRYEPRGLTGINESPGRPRLVGTHVKVGPTRPDGTPHPHAGKTGRITRFIDTYSDPYWLGRPAAMIQIDAEVLPLRFIWVSVECLESLAY